MKKVVKISLIAAMATTGLTSTASAKDLTEAIKDVDVSGSIVYRYNDYNSDNKASNKKHGAKNHYKAVVNVKSKVNDDVTANVSLAVNNNFSGSKTSEKGDENFDLELTKVNFAYTGIANTTVTLGKQGIDTPWTKASHVDGDEQTGTGIMTMSTLGSVNVIAGYFNQTNLQESGSFNNATVFDGSEDIATIGAVTNIAGVSLDAWYMTFDGEGSVSNDTSFDSYTVGAKYGFNIAGVKFGLDGRYTALEFDDINGAKQVTDGFSEVSHADATTDNSLWKVGLTAKKGIFGAKIAYAQTSEDGGFVGLDKSNAQTGLNGWITNLNGIRDASMIKTNVNADITSKMNLALNYNEVDSNYNDADDHEETFAQLTYKMSKNFKTYIRYGQYSETNGGEEIDSDIGRLQVQYTF